MIFLELCIFFSTVMPLFHLFNALLTRRKQRIADGLSEKKVSIIIPCFNEEDTVALSVRGLIHMDYRHYEAIYINDGSTDGTFEKLMQLLMLKPVPGVRLHEATLYQSEKYRNFRVIDKPNGGKSAALNMGLLIARCEIVVTLDADSVLDRNAMKIINSAFEDPTVVAAGGAIHIMQGYDPSFYRGRYRGFRNALVSLQMLEYIKGFYIYKLSLAKQNAMAIISGAFGAFRRTALVSVGGFRNTLGEDIDITMRIQQMIHNTKMKVLYLPEALCYTQCPENWRDLLRQRLRWQKGFVDCTVHHRKFLLRTFLFKSLSFHYLVEAFVVGQMSCIFTALNYLLLIALALIYPSSLLTFLFYFILCIIINILYTLGAMLMSSRYHHYPRGSWKKKLMAVVLDVLFYRFFNLITYTAGTVSYFWNRRDTRWYKAARSSCIASQV